MRPATLRLTPDSRAWQILSHVARHESATIAELVEAVGVTTTAIRQQVTHLLNEGWLERGQHNNGPGRPANVFKLSEDGRRLFAYDVDEFARLLLHELVERETPEKVAALLNAVHQRMMRRVAGAADADNPAEQFEQLAEYFMRRGTVADADRSATGTRLRVFTCPFHGVAHEQPHICELERDSLAELTGRSVELRSRLIDGERCCEFAVAPAHDNTNADDQES